MDICVFQGTFNPIHNAHLRIAEYTLKNYAPGGIIFIPAYKPPHKSYNNSMAIHRYNMVKLAIHHNNKFKISDIEYQREGKSYTYLTIQELYKLYAPKNKIKFIIGTDAFKNIETWFETEKLKNLVDFLVFPRENNFSENNIKFLRQKGYNYEFIPLDFYDISSTELRNMIKLNMPLNRFIPKEVEEYIIKNDLYKD